MHDYYVKGLARDGRTIWVCRACKAVVHSTGGKAPAQQSCPVVDEGESVPVSSLVDLPCTKRTGVRIVQCRTCSTSVINVEVGDCSEFGERCTLSGGKVEGKRTRACLYCDVPRRLAAEGELNGTSSE